MSEISVSEREAGDWVAEGLGGKLFLSARLALEMFRRVRELEAERDALRKDAERYRWLAERFTGYDFNWMPSEEGALDGKSCIVFEASEGFSGGRDIGAAIDAVIATKEQA